MSDGPVVLPMAARPGAERSLLFPVTPQPGETLLGFVMRRSAKNYFCIPEPVARHINVDLLIKGDLPGRLKDWLDG